MIKHCWNMAGEYLGATATVKTPDGGYYETPVFDTVAEAQVHAEGINLVLFDWWHEGDARIQEQVERDLEKRGAGRPQ